jgi:Spy/CpxP family protein refolding chaperone
MDKAREDAPPMKREAFKGHMEKMGSLIKAETLDADALTAGHDEMQAKRREMQVKMFSTYLDALEVLSPEQRTALFELKKEHKGKKGQEGMFGPDGKKGHKGMKGHFKHKGPSGFLLKAIRKMGDELELTEEQMADIKALKDSSRADCAPLKDKKRALRKEMHALMTAAQLDRAAIEAKHAEILDVKQEKESKRFALTIQALEILSVDQRTQLVTTLESCRPGKGMKGDATCKKLFGHKKGGKHFHKKPPMAEEMPAW